GDGEREGDRHRRDGGAGEEVFTQVSGSEARLPLRSQVGEAEIETRTEGGAPRCAAGRSIFHENPPGKSGWKRDGAHRSEDRTRRTYVPRCPILSAVRRTKEEPQMTATGPEPRVQEGHDAELE